MKTFKNMNGGPGMNRDEWYLELCQTVAKRANVYQDRLAQY